MTQTRFKKIPFDLELAKKITNKDVKGRIVTLEGRKVRIVCWDKKPIDRFPIVVIAQNDCEGEMLYTCTEEGLASYPNYKNRYNLIIEIPTYHKDYSNFKPYKWQSCVVRDYSSDTWRIEVCCGIDSNGVPIFYSRNNSDGYEDYKHFLPLSNITKRLIGTSNSYEDLIKELDAESTATTKNNDNGKK